MSLTRIASRYAKSILDLAKERGELETVLADMETVQKAMESRDLVLLLKSPVVKTDKKSKIFNMIFEGKLSKLSIEFFNIVMRKGREMYIPNIVTEYIEAYKKLKKISSISLTTAEALDPSIIEAIENKLLASDATEEKVDIESHVDPSIIGGFIIEIGDKLYDDSVKGKLDKLKKSFTKNEYDKAF